MNQRTTDDDLFELYDEYCHGDMKRREFLRRAAVLAAGAGLAGCGRDPEAMLPDYAKVVTVPFTDPRIKARYVDYQSPGGNGPMRGYLVTPADLGDEKRGAVLVVHENRGLNPYVKDVARRVAVEGFIALAPDALAPLGGYPGNDDDGKAMQRELDRDKIFVDMQAGAELLLAHEACNGRLGVTGFCFGGEVSNRLAVEMGDRLQAAAPFYGRPPDLDRVNEIRAKLVIHYAEDDPRVNEHKDAYEAALRAANVDFRMHVYPGTRHGFHNNSTPRYDHDAATLAWGRTLELFRATLA
jgi:carboxymethylenebutenolidase